MTGSADPSEVLGPFRAGAGRLPPHLAGREAEQSLLRLRLQILRSSAAPPNEVLLYGPRGSGKTALLLWLEEQARSQPGIEVVRLFPSSLPDLRALTEALRRRSWVEQLTGAEAGWRGFRLRFAARGSDPLAEILQRRVSRTPLLAVVDEAHTLDIAVGRALLNASQFVGGTMPFQLVLAGTPHLRAHLRRMGASFWNRARMLRIGRLTEQAAADALVRPLRAEGIRVEPGALADMVRASQNYPYFIQLLGQAVWLQTAGAGSDRVTARILRAALRAFGAERDNYYLDRFNELIELRLVGAARVAARAFRERGPLTHEEVRAALGAEGGEEFQDADARYAAVRHLEQLGFLWQPKPRPFYEPGIPSLMDYVLEAADPGEAPVSGAGASGSAPRRPGE